MKKTRFVCEALVGDTIEFVVHVEVVETPLVVPFAATYLLRGARTSNWCECELSDANDAGSATEVASRVAARLAHEAGGRCISIKEVGHT